ncbi:thioredoxin family protein [bacterium]|nr:thioredoxin family protein [bacterium]
MKIVIIGSTPLRSDLFARTSEVLEELGLTDIVNIRESDDEAYKLELGITENPALCIEEESIDFKDVIFQGIIPEKSEIKSLLISIV